MPVTFQSGTLATPPSGTTIATDRVVSGGIGTEYQQVKIDVGPAGTSVLASYAAGTGLPVQGVGTFQTLGTFQPLAGSVHLASGTVQALGTVQPLAGSVHLASSLPGGTLGGGTFQVHGTAHVLGSVQTVGTAQTLGTVAQSFTLPTAAALSSGSINIASAGNNVVVGSVAGQTIRVFKLFLVSTGTNQVAFIDNTINYTGSMPFKAGGAMALDLDGEPWYVTNVGSAFVVNLGVGSQINGRIYYTRS